MQSSSIINSYFFHGSLFGKEYLNVKGPLQNLVHSVINSVSINDEKECKEFLNNLFTSFFIHDITFIKTTDLFILYKYLPLSGIIRLIQSGGIKFVDDNGLNMNVQFDKQGNSYLGFLTNCVFDTGKTNKPILFDSSFEYLEFETRRMGIAPDEQNAILINVEKLTTSLNPQQLLTEIQTEVKSNLLNKNLTNKIALESEDITRLSEQQAYRLLRVNQSSQALLYSAHLSTSNIICESDSINDYNLKFATLNRKYSETSTGVFAEIAKASSVPNFTELILNGTITIDQFMELREKKGARKLRDWLAVNEFNKDALLRHLLSDLDKNSTVVKLLRWSLTTLAGLIEPITGTILDAADTFVVDKLINGWQPRLYLNNELKGYFDKKVRAAANAKTSSINQKYFPNTGRNDKCPCGSGKKFKHCCGK